MPLDFAKHKTILLRLLKDIYTDTRLAPHLGFKGGTAAFLFYGLNRMSVDLDFDLLEDADKEEVLKRLTAIAEAYGAVEDARIKRYNILVVISPAPGAQKVKIEVNCRQFGSQYEMKTTLGISMLVMVQEDMFAHKLMALYERVANRDIFDVHYFFAQGWDINQKIVENRADMSFKEAVAACIAKLKQVDNKHILDGVGELLTESQKDWARAKLKEETIFFLQLLIHNKS